jgi:fructokinase
MNKLIAIGECLVDMLPDDSGGFTPKAGGAPANVAACVAKLGAPAYFLGKLADDIFCPLLKGALKRAGVGVKYAVFDKNAQTALAFVTLKEDGDREFSFYRNMTADMLLSPDELANDLFEEGDILHFCSVALKPSPTKEAHKKAIALARAANALVSFDVNLRRPLWNDDEGLKKTVNQFLPYADIVKLSQDELEFLTGKTIIDESGENTAVKTLFEAAPSAKLILLTKGAHGSRVFDRAVESIFTPSTKVKAVDATGAGDCFIGSVLYKLLIKQADLTLKGIEEAVKFASVASGIVVGKKGAMEAMPSHEEIDAYRD